jgi:hypothetical protein
VRWFEFAGKFLLFLAGLVAVLDVAGKHAVDRWADKAEGRRDFFGSLRNSLRAVWPHLKAAGRIAKESVTGEGDDAVTVREQTRAELIERRTPAVLINDPRFTFPARERRAQLLIASRLEQGEREQLNRYILEFRAFAVHVRAGIGLAQIIIIPLMIWIFWGNGVMILGGWLTYGGGIMLLGTSLLAPRVTLWVRWAYSIVSYRVAATAQHLLVREGRPLRAFALTLFILGSFIDLYSFFLKP